MYKIRSKLYTVLTFVTILIVWYLSSLKVNSLFIPSPIKVWNDAKLLFSTGQLPLHIWYTFKRILTATCLSGMIALPLGLLIYNFKFMRATINPVVNMLRYVPVTAFYPLLIMWLGIQEEMKIAFLFIATFVYMMPSVVLSLEEINPDLIETGMTIGMNKIQTITRIQLPATLPSILNSFIMMVGIGFTYSAVCETINARFGLGFMIQQGSSRGRTDLVFLGIIVIMLISFVFDYIAKKLVKIIFKWRYINDMFE